MLADGERRPRRTRSLTHIELLALRGLDSKAWWINCRQIRPRHCGGRYMSRPLRLSFRPSYSALVFFPFQLFPFLQHTQPASQCLEVDVRVHHVPAQVKNAIALPGTLPGLENMALGSQFPIDLPDNGVDLHLLYHQFMPARIRPRRSGEMRKRKRPLTWHEKTLGRVCVRAV
jgi:hypothetical protein